MEAVWNKPGDWYHCDIWINFVVNHGVIFYCLFYGYCFMCLVNYYFLNNFFFLKAFVNTIFWYLFLIIFFNHIGLINIDFFIYYFYMVKAGDFAIISPEHFKFISDI